MFKVFRYVLEPKGIEQEGDSAWAVEADEENVSDPTALLREGFNSEVDLPVGAEVVLVGLSSRGLTLYALVNPDAETITRSFFICGNGVELPLPAEVDERKAAQMHVGTFKVPGGLTAHVFETTEVLASL